LFVLPLSLAKELKRLTYFCMISFIFVVYLCILVIVECWTYPKVSFSTNFADTQNFLLAGITTTLPTAVFAYMSHPNVLDIYKVFFLGKSQKLRNCK
jgi:amino acid permease